MPRQPGDKAAASERVEPEMVLDFNGDGRLIGIEILDPHEVNFEAINDILQKHGFLPLSEKALAPIVAAWRLKLDFKGEGVRRMGVYASIRHIQELLGHPSIEALQAALQVKP